MTTRSRAGRDSASGLPRTDVQARVTRRAGSGAACRHGAGSPAGSNGSSAPRNRRMAGVLTWGPGNVASPPLRWTTHALVFAGAALLVVSAAIHLHLWDNGYSGVAVIGPLFLAQGVVGILLGVSAGVLARLAFVLSAAGMLTGTAVALLLSVSVGLFGFRDSLAAPYAEMSLVVELVGAALLLAAAALVVTAGRAADSRTVGDRVPFGA